MVFLQCVQIAAGKPLPHLINIIRQFQLYSQNGQWERLSSRDFLLNLIVMHANIIESMRIPVWRNVVFERFEHPYLKIRRAIPLFSGGKMGF